MTPRVYPRARLLERSEFAPYTLHPRGYYTTYRTEHVRRAWWFVAGLVAGACVVLVAL